MILILNNKANINYEEIKYYEKKIRKYNIIILPSVCYMPLFQKGKYILGAQDVSEYSETNRTGEINAKQLKSLNIKYCLIGHSERRIYNEEKEQHILNKLKRCFENNITPLYCISELYKENNNELKKQIDIIETTYKKENIIYVYEPIDNIGNTSPKLNDIKEKIDFIKKYIKETYNKNINLIYGGGVNPSNIEYIKNINNLDGIIISTSSLNLKNFKEIYNSLNNSE